MKAVIFGASSFGPLKQKTTQKQKGSFIMKAVIFFFVPIGAFGYYSSGAGLFSSPFLSSSGLSSFDSYELEQLKADSFRMKQEIDKLKRKAECEELNRILGIESYCF